MGGRMVVRKCQVLGLAEPGAGDDADAGLLEEREARRVGDALGQRDPGERVHRARDGVARDARNRVEAALDEHGAAAQASRISPRSRT